MNRTKLKQVEFECDDLYFNWVLIEYKATLECKAILYNPTSEELHVKQLNGQPNMSISTSAILLQPSELKKLSNIRVSVESYHIPAQGITTVEFTSTIGDVPLYILEKNLFGRYYSISLPYTVHLKTSDVSFVGYGEGQIKQNNGEVAIDVGINIFIAKGSYNRR